MNSYATLVFLLVVAAFAASAWLPGRWSALAWLVPLAVAVLYFVAWLDERQPPDQGDSQPGLVALVGVVAVLVSVAAAGLGRFVRRRGGHGG